MTQTLTLPTPTLHLPVPQGSRLFTWAAGTVAELRARLTLASAHEVVRELDARQLADAGIDASAILPARPTITVERGLMNRLMTLP